MHNFTTRGAVVEIVPSEASFHFQLRSSFWSSFENLNIILFKSTFKEIPSPFVFSGLLPQDKLQKIVLQVSAWNFLHTLDLIHDSTERLIHPRLLVTLFFPQNSWTAPPCYPHQREGPVSMTTGDPRECRVCFWSAAVWSLNAEAGVWQSRSNRSGAAIDIQRGGRGSGTIRALWAPTTPPENLL